MVTLCDLWDYNIGSVAGSTCLRCMQEYDNQQDTVKEIIKLVQKDKTISQFIDLLYKIKHSNNTEKQTKSICSLNRKDKSDADPLVYLEIEGYHVRQVVLDFRSQVNIMNWDTILPFCTKCIKSFTVLFRLSSTSSYRANSLNTFVASLYICFSLTGSR